VAKADILVAGAGAAGLSAAIALSMSGFSVLCAGPTDTNVNGRTVALFEGSLRFFRSLGLWRHLYPQAGPIEKIRMIDATGSALPIPPVEFSAREIGLEIFGANIENNLLVAKLSEIAETIPDLTRHDGFLTDIIAEADTQHAVLDNGTSVETKLIVAADGRKSLARSKARIAARSWTYPQIALTLLLAHAKPHQAISTEFHTRSGPCTLVPLPASKNDPHRSSLVWLMSKAEAERRQQLDDKALADEIERQVHGVLGPMRLDSPRGFFPMAGMRVSRLVGHRTALVGEAAHVFPPLAAQGLNLSLRDTAMLVDCLENARAAGRDIGTAQSLAAYQTSRHADVSLRTNAVDVLNRSLLSDFLPVDLIRGAGLLAFNLIGPFRRAIMREGVLPHDHLPRLMRPLSVQRVRTGEAFNTSGHNK
jgi:2-octaprenyl-6-methoxyphenol hydroxylase